MTKLTEHTVLARTRAQDLRSVRKLNAWGSELTDVSIVRKLPNVEVLSLSVNSISSLEDFSHCSSLQELYIRKNNITELGEIRHLQDLPKLRNLWLADNPCAECADYRLTVIRALPQLQKLDNMPIRPDEKESALKHGSPLEVLLPQEEEEELNMSQTMQQQAVIESSPSFEEISSVTHTESFSVENTAYSPVATNNGTDGYHVVKNAVKQTEFINHSSQQSYQDQYSQEYSYPERERVIQNNMYSAETSPVNSHPGVQYQENFDRDYQELDHTPDTPMSSKEHFSPKCGFPPPYVQRLPQQRSERPTAIRMLPKGGKSRAANILSAVLCLIKELDWASLEVVDTAIHCQMEELEEQNSS